jgi:RNA polymerase sigma-70 factor, ECF subfamily
MGWPGKPGPARDLAAAPGDILVTAMPGHVTQESQMPSATGAAGFDEFYGASSMRVVRYAYALTGNLADAQDLTQEAFARAWQRWGFVSGCDSPEAWVRRVVANLATSRWRRRRIASAAIRDLASASHLPEVGPDTVALVAGLRTLPDRQRVVLVLHYLADLPIAQIAAELGCPVGSVKAWLSRGRAALAEAIGEQRSDQEVADA